MRPHVIARVVFDCDIATAGGAAKVQERLSRFGDGGLGVALDAGLHGKNHRIERLEVDLGDLPLVDLERRATERLVAALRSLPDDGAASATPPGSGTPATAPEAPHETTDVALHFLRTGLAHWADPAPARQSDENWAHVLSRSAPALQAWAQSVLDIPGGAARLADAMPPKLFDTLLTRLNAPLARALGAGERLRRTLGWSRAEFSPLWRQVVFQMAASAKADPSCAEEEAAAQLAALVAPPSAAARPLPAPTGKITADAHVEPDPGGPAEALFARPARPLHLEVLLARLIGSKLEAVEPADDTGDLAAAFDGALATHASRLVAALHAAAERPGTISALLRYLDWDRLERLIHIISPADGSFCVAFLRVASVAHADLPAALWRAALSVLLQRPTTAGTRAEWLEAVLIRTAHRTGLSAPFIAQRLTASLDHAALPADTADHAAVATFLRHAAKSGGTPADARPDGAAGMAQRPADPSSDSLPTGPVLNVTAPRQPPAVDLVSAETGGPWAATEAEHAPPHFPQPSPPDATRTMTRRGAPGALMETSEAARAARPKAQPTDSAGASPQDAPVSRPGGLATPEGSERANAPLFADLLELRFGRAAPLFLHLRYASQAAPSGTLRGLLSDLLAGDPALAADVLSPALHGVSARYRLARLLASRDRKAALAAFGWASDAVDLAGWLDVAIAASGLLDRPNARFLVTRCLLESAASAADTSDTASALIRRALRGLLLTSSLPAAEIARRLADAARPRNHRGHALLTEQVDIVARFPEHPPEAAVPERPSQPADLPNAISVPTAGAVILWPFLPRFFAALDLLGAEGFASPRARARGVQILHYLATGDAHPDQGALPLAKLLCGLDLRHPIPLSRPLSADEAELSLDLLISVTRLWPGLENTTVSGLREAFLCRNGLLKGVGSANPATLHVETRAYDLLLDRLPWALSFVSLSWMAAPLNVRWRAP